MFYPRGSVGILKMMREIQIETGKKPPVPPKARPAAAEPKAAEMLPLTAKQHATPAALSEAASSSSQFPSSHGSAGQVIFAKRHATAAYADTDPEEDASHGGEVIFRQGYCAT